MSNVIPFVPKEGLAAKASLKEFIHWAKSQIHFYDLPSDPIKWTAMNWHRWGLKQTLFTKYGEQSETLHPDFVDYAKALLFYQRSVQLSEDTGRLRALRFLEAALLTITQKGDVTAVTAAIFDKACIFSLDFYTNALTAYQISRQLKYIHDHLHSTRIVAKPFIWEPQIKLPRQTLKKSEEDAYKKLPSTDVLMALGNIFKSKPRIPVDIMTTSAVALMLSQPSRIGELKYVKKDCLFTEHDAQGREQLFILWYSLKSFGANRKPIIGSMAKICQEAVERLIEITEEARGYAKWLEENPDLFPYHSGVPSKGQDEPLSLQEACNSLNISKKNSLSKDLFKSYLSKIVAAQKTSVRMRNIALKLLDGFDSRNGTRGNLRQRVGVFEVHDAPEITLRILNVIVRKKYLNKDFPYTDSKRVIKWQHALFCFRTGALVASK